jgi:hypothetical protein
MKRLIVGLLFAGSLSLLAGGFYAYRMGVDLTAVVAAGIVAGIIFVLYFVPSFVAMSRHKVSASAIVALNLFLGWSILGWVISLIWALKVDQVDLTDTST